MSKITIIEGNSNNKDNVRAIMVKGEKGEQGDLNHNDIIDNLTSTSADKVLSANQGKILKDLVDVNTDNISSNAESIDNEINTRQNADTTLQTNINSEASVRENADANLQSQISSLASGSPLTASSTSEMTDTTKVYVNTTDGNWYYYNGSAWTIGGVYQSTGLDIGSVSINNFNDLTTDSLYKKVNIDDLAMVRLSGGITSSGEMATTPLYLKKGTIVSVSEKFLNSFSWRLRYYVGNNNWHNASGSLNSSSYTVLEDALAEFTYIPKSGTTWEDITDFSVDIPLTSEDVTLEGYFKLTKDGNVNELIDNNINLSNFTIIGTYSYYFYRPSNNRAMMPKIIKSSYPVLVKVKEGWNLGVHTWTEPDKYGQSNFINDTGWLTGTYLIPANTYFALAFKKIDNSNVLDEEIKDGIFSLTSYTTYDAVDEKISEALVSPTQYSYKGEKIDFNKKGINYELYQTISLPNSQGMAIYDDYMFIYFATHYLRIYNKNTMQQLGEISINLEHGDTLQFSEEFYNNSDIAPIMYVTSDTNPGYCYVVRISNLTTAEVLKIYTFDVETNGYYQGYTCDFMNKKLYCLGYKENDFHTNATGTNKTIVSIYDLTQETLVSDNIYTLALIERYELPFIYCIQGQKWFEGKIFCNSSYHPNEQLSQIVVIDTYKKAIVSIFDDLPTNMQNDELEDLDFVLGNNNKYYIIVSAREHIYKLTF